MAVTRSTPQSREASRSRTRTKITTTRAPELIWLILAGIIISGAWWLVYSAKIRRPESPAPPLNVSRVDRAEKLYPVLAVIQSPADREFIARRIFDAIAEDGGTLPNTGAIARIRPARADLMGDRKLDDLRKRAEEAKTNTVGLLTPAQFAQLKPQIIVRDFAGFKREFLLWAGAILVAFVLTNLVWTIRGFTGPLAFLPLLLLLTGIGFALMVALRDPLRDTMIFIPFAQGVVGGCLLMLLASFVNWESTTASYSFVPLLGAIVLSLALIFFGSGPSGSDARVNLGPFQPVEVIKILLVFFLAGYFSKRWPLLRQLREKRFVIPGIELPPLEYAAPVMIGVGLAVVFFYLQRDLGPALVFAAVFLTLYAIARNRAPLAVIGMATLLGGFLAGYFLGTPKTVHDRVSMWLSPWSNTVRGGDQVVHSLWAMASGGPLGTGPGLGESDVIPAGYTDLIVSVLGEEWGFLGIITVYSIFALLIWLGLRVA
ncbi:MAG: hypothetical protein QOJ99_5795, partial [Bryobacterales bacterium]|nr:hypothetical protein [Bryobacterales bacterium]